MVQPAQYANVQGIQLSEKWWQAHARDSQDGSIGAKPEGDALCVS
tara:strand:- start:905 stop:1039 length:135 start_codon:yes stop_codon:yes gene_type:complete